MGSGTRLWEPIYYFVIVRHSWALLTLRQVALWHRHGHPKIKTCVCPRRVGTRRSLVGTSYAAIWVCVTVRFSCIAGQDYVSFSRCGQASRRPRQTETYWHITEHSSQSSRAPSSDSCQGLRAISPKPPHSFNVTVTTLEPLETAHSDIISYSVRIAIRTI
jgi:hypothetical protein